LKPSRRDRATAVAVVALLHGAVLLCVSLSMRLSPSEVHAATALPLTLIHVALETIDAPKPALRRASRPPQVSTPSAAPSNIPSAQESAPHPGPEPAAAIALDSASAAASDPLRKKSDASVTEVTYLENPPPAYPAASLREREQGRVLVSVLVSCQGLVEEAAVKVSSGFPRLDAAALTSVRSWRFVPAQRAGLAVEARINVPVRFELSDD
jgi:protein TonB